MTSIRTRIFAVVALAALAACSTEKTVDNTVDGTLWVANTAVKGTVGAAKLAVKGTKGAYDLVAGE